MIEALPLRRVAEITLGRMRDPASEDGPLQTNYLRAANVADGRLRLDDVKSMHFSLREQARYALREGDVLVTEASGSRHQVGQTALVDGGAVGLMFQNTLLRLRPLAGLDGRYLYWWSRHAYASGLYSQAAQGLGIWHLGAERLGIIGVPTLSMGEQRRIADFLDDQVALLELAHNLVLKRKRLLIELFRAQLADSVIVSPALYTRARLIDLFHYERNGIWGSEPDGGVDDVPCVRVADFDRVAFRASAAPTVRNVPRNQRLPRLLMRGDVLLEKSGGSHDKPVGCAVMYESDSKAICSNFIAAMRPRAFVDPTFAGLVMAAYYQTRRNAPFVTQTTGIQNLDSAAYLRLPIGVPPLTDQLERVGSVVADRQQCEAGLALLALQERLLQERKQALITAAVTGQFDVTTARSVA